MKKNGFMRVSFLLISTQADIKLFKLILTVLSLFSQEALKLEKNGFLDRILLE